MKQFLLALLIAPFLAGCFGSAPPVPRDHYYRLVVTGPERQSAGTPFPGVMTVEAMQADGLLRERPLLFSESGESYEVQQHDYHYWTDAPPRLLQDQMVAFLRRSSAADLVVTPDIRVRSDYQVRGKAKRFERLLGGGPPRVVVEMELALVRISDDALILVDTYSEEVLAADDSVDAAVVALNQATARIFDRFLDEAVIAAAKLPARQQADREN